MFCQFVMAIQNSSKGVNQDVVPRKLPSADAEALFLTQCSFLFDWFESGLLDLHKLLALPCRGLVLLPDQVQVPSVVFCYLGFC